MREGVRLSPGHLDDSYAFKVVDLSEVGMGTLPVVFRALKTRQAAHGR